MGSGRQTPERGAGDGTPRGDWAGTGLLGAKSPPSRPGGVLIAAVSSGRPARAGTVKCRGGGHGRGRVQEGTHLGHRVPCLLWRGAAQPGPGAADGKGTPEEALGARDGGAGRKGQGHRLVGQGAG